MAKRQYSCQFCGKSPINGYQAHSRHERKCALNPDNKPGSGPAEQPVVIPGVINPLETEEPANVAPGAAAAAVDPPPVKEPAQTPGDISGAFAAIEQKFAALELTMGQRLQASIDAIQANLNTVPQLLAEAVDKSVDTYMSAKLGIGAAPPVEGPGAAAGAGPGTAVAAPPAPRPGGLAGAFAGINIESIAMAWLDSQGGPEKALVNLMGQFMKPKGPPAPADPKYSSRGMSFFLSAIRNKKADSDAQATTLRSLATSMLADKNLDSGSRSYYAGIKAAADSYMEGRQMEKVKEAAESKNIVAPALPAAVTQP